MTDINDLAKDIKKEIEKYSKETEKELRKAQRIVSKEMVQDLDQHSPKRTGDYKGEWTITKRGNSLIVHNKGKYQLTHLLEYGHVKRGGKGRTTTKAHIRPAEAYMINDYLKRIKKALKR